MLNKQFGSSKSARKLRNKISYHLHFTYTATNIFQAFNASAMILVEPIRLVMLATKQLCRAFQLVEAPIMVMLLARLNTLVELPGVVLCNVFLKLIFAASSPTFKFTACFSTKDLVAAIYKTP